MAELRWRSRQLVEEYEAENGEAVIRYKTVTDPFNLETAELYQQFWEEVGLTDEIDQIEQGDFIGEALGVASRPSAGATTAASTPTPKGVVALGQRRRGGTLALNFGRIQNDELDEQLGIIRTSSDEEERQATAEEVSRIFADQVFNIWNDWTIWAIRSPTTCTASPRRSSCRTTASRPSTASASPGG